MFPVPCGLGDGYHREDQAFPWHSDVPSPECFHVNAACSPWQPPAGAVAPGTAGKVSWGRSGPGAPAEEPEWNGQCKGRDVPSYSHLVLNLLLVSLSRMGFAGTPVPCNALPEDLGGLKADKINVFPHS